MIKEKNIKLTINRGNKGYYKKLRPECQIGDTITLNIHELPRGSNLYITPICDHCGKECKLIQYNSYINIIEHSGSYVCSDCYKDRMSQLQRQAYDEHGDEIKARREKTCMERFGYRNPMLNPKTIKKQQETNLIRYGSTSVMHNEEILQRRKDNMIEKYGVDNPAKIPEVQEKKMQTNILKYDTPYAISSDVVRKKIINTFQEKYNVDNPFQMSEVRQKVITTMYKNQTCPTSSQQKYLYNLFGGELNYPLGFYSLDIALVNEKIDLEYNGKGHALKVLLGNVSEEEFKLKEIIRGKYVKSQGWKSIHIISCKDKLPSDEILLQILDFSKQYFRQYPNHSWIEWDIDKGIYRNAENKEGVPFNFGELRRIKKDEVA